MTKKIILALALAASVVAIALPSFALHSHDVNVERNIACRNCNGTGLYHGFRCSWCKGTGFKGSY